MVSIRLHVGVARQGPKQARSLSDQLVSIRLHVGVARQVLFDGIEQVNDSSFNPSSRRSSPSGVAGGVALAFDGGFQSVFTSE